MLWGVEFFFSCFHFYSLLSVAMLCFMLKYLGFFLLNQYKLYLRIGEDLVWMEHRDSKEMKIGKKLKLESYAQWLYAKAPPASWDRASLLY